jgi:hypothetical protein
VLERRHAAYQVDDVPGGEGKDVGAGDLAWAFLFDPGLDPVDRIVTIPGEGIVVL